MGQVKNSSRPLHAGSLKWTAVQPDQAQPFRQDSRQEGVVPSLPRSPAFLEGLPPVGAGYAPREPITRNLQRLIQDHGYAGAFARAISAVSCPNIPELDQIQTLEQFYFLIDAMVTWIPELRVWEWKGEIYHERTDYLRITQFYYYSSQPDLLALQSPVDPHAGDSF